MASGSLQRSDVESLLSDLLSASGQEPLRVTSARQFFETYLEEKAKSRAVATALRYRAILIGFIEFLGTRADLPLAHLSSRDVQSFRDGELARGVSSQSANMIIKVLRGPFNRARRQGLLAVNPAEGVDFVGGEALARRAFTLEEMRAVLAVADWEWKGMILLGYCCGFRIQDAANLTYAEIDFERQVIRLRPKKERRDRVAKKTETVILPELREWLEANRRDPVQPLFPSFHGRYTGGQNGLSLAFRELLKKAGVKFVNLAESGSLRRFYDLGFHALRHSCVTHAANAGVPEEIRREHVGHASDVHRTYTHREVAVKQRAFADMPRLKNDPELDLWAVG
jgi:integrase